MRVKKIVLYSSLVVLAFIAVLAISVLRPAQDKIEIAIAAPLSNIGQSTLIGGESMVKGAQLYIDWVNQAGGINGKKIKLQVYDDRNDPKVAAEVAHKIVDSNALAVIGHYSSSTSLVAGKIYQAYGIPAISGSATADDVTKWNNWYFRSTFVNSRQGLFIANYISKILKRSQISLIYSPDSYGSSLAEDITSVYTELGGEIINRWSLDTEADKPVGMASQRDAIVDDLVAMQKSGQDPGAIFISAGREAASDLIVKMRLYELNLPILGGDALADIAFATKFVNTPEERDNPGFFTNDVYSLTPILFDISGEMGQQFRTEYEQRYDSVPGWIAAANYDAAHAVVAAIADLGDEEQPLSMTLSKAKRDRRYLVKEALANLKPIDTTIQTFAIKNKHFNKLGDVTTPLLVGVFERGKFTSAYTQLQAIQDLKTVDNLDRQLEANKIVKVGSEYMRLTDIVYTGIDVNQVTNIDEKTSTYLMDFYLWFRYQGKDVNPEQIEFSNYGIERLDSGERLTIGVPLKTNQQEGVDYQLYRIQADFKEEFDFRNYPFDGQTLAVRFRHTNLTRDKLIYAIDYIGMKETTTPGILAKWERGKVFSEITDWIVDRVSFYPDIVANQSTLGDRRFVDTDAQIEYSRFNAVIDIKRDIFSFSVKDLLPLMFFIVVAYLLLFLPFEYVSVEAVSGLLLAVVFYHLSLIEKLPEGVGYVVALDYAFYIVYGLLGLELLLVTVGHSKWFTTGKIQLKQLMDFGRLSFPTLLFISFGLLYWQFAI